MATTGIPFFPDHWYYNTESGQLTKGNNLENLGNNLLGGLGWHELNIPGNATEAQAAAEAKREFPKGTPPTTAGITPKRVIDNAANQASGNNAGSQGAGPFGTLAEFLGVGHVSGSNLAVRIAKVVIGGTLLIIGLSRMTGVSNAVTKAVENTKVVPV